MKYLTPVLMIYAPVVRSVASVSMPFRKSYVGPTKITLSAVTSSGDSMSRQSFDRDETRTATFEIP